MTARRMAHTPQLRVLRQCFDTLGAERDAAGRQMRRLERLAERIARLDLRTLVGREMAIQALARLAHLVKAARAYAERLDKDAHALHEAAFGHEEPPFTEPAA